MSLTLAILISTMLSCLSCFPQIRAKPSPPQAAQAKKIEREIKRSDWYPKSQRQHLQQLNGVIFTFKQASQSRDTDTTWVIYSLAMKQANAAGDLTLSHHAARMMEDRWEMPDEFLLQWHADAIKRARNDAQITELAKLFQQDVQMLGAAEPVKDWEKAYKKVRRAAAKSRSEFTKLACQKVFAETDAWMEVAAGLQKRNVEAIGYREILSGKVSLGIKRLAQSDNNKVAAAAKLIGQSNAKFSGAHERLLLALANSKSSAAKLAGQRIFESLAGELDEKQINTCQRICFGMMEPLPLRGNFALPFYGVPRGYLDADNGKLNELGYGGDSKQWIFNSNASVDWPSTPYENYVQEIELTITAIEGEIRIVYGGEDSAVVRFDKEDKAIRTRLLHRIGKGYNWKGSRSIKPGEKVTVKVYRTPERMFAFLNGARLNSRTVGLGWNRIRFRVGKGSQMVVSKIMTRPWLPGDREVLKKIAGENKSIDTTATEASMASIDRYLKYIQSCKGAGPKPVVGKPFVTPNDIVMRPVTAGVFQRGEDSRKVMISHDFYCSAHEITQMQFAGVMGFNPASLQGNPLLPVDNVSLTDATSFCEQLTKSMSRKGLIPSGYEYRLPTEAEWTFAAMDDGQNDMDVPEDQYWNWETAKGGFQMVGTSTPNKRGLYDMHGNVEELTADAFTKRNADDKDPKDVADPVEVPTTNSPIVVKGGSWNVGSNQCSAKQRDRSNQVGTPGRGFRVVLAKSWR